MLLTHNCCRLNSGLLRVCVFSGVIGESH